MALREIGDDGRTRDLLKIDHENDFNRIWLKLSAQERGQIEDEINRRLDRLIASPDPNWGSITNTSIEGGTQNPRTGLRGDWSGTVFEPIYVACRKNENLAGMFYGNVWKKVIIDRHELWIGIRPEPTFPNRGITLGGKSYFLAQGGTSAPQSGSQDA